jgi:hypothetical protein
MRTNICEAWPGIPFKPDVTKESEEHAKAVSRAFKKVCKSFT